MHASSFDMIERQQPGFRGGKELKGVRSRLLECYRGWYFDAMVDMEPKQQVNRIAKNMIE